MSVANIRVLQEPFRKRKWCLRDFANTQEGCEIISQQHAIFAGLRSWLPAWGSQLPSRGICRATSEGKTPYCTKRLRNHFATKWWFPALWKMLPSTGSNWLAKAATSSFQLRIVYRLKHWIFDFLSFEMVYTMHHLDFRKCSKSGFYDCHQEYALWQILFAFSPCNTDSLLTCFGDQNTNKNTKTYTKWSKLL